MKKIYYLSTCDTCKRILREWEPADDVILQDIKKNPLGADELALLHERSGSYEALLNKRAQLYKARKLGEKELSEGDCRELLLEQYTFLKRPVLLTDHDIFIGNSKNIVAQAKEALHR